MENKNNGSTNIAIAALLLLLGFGTGNLLKAPNKPVDTASSEVINQLRNSNVKLEAEVRELKESLTVYKDICENTKK